ncbi:Asp-tRNA(Asn)/Glu-tRNA(Gln) amidotransferase subunit GatB [Candidatus Woesebacteria bacterium]|nr:Asp-tRNA(Asn)/Glu-tRNA(Gln) amidotransferase subunit GatB [Candidatus Woesebacteria bacterium]
MSEKDYTLVVGLEIHVQLATKSKMFDRCSADWFGKAPNTVVGPLTLGLPGTLPVPNKKAIQWAILIGKALNCSTNRISKFDRKHYFYPDLPKGYQISQYDEPFSYDGYYDLRSKVSKTTKRIRIKRVHLEEDTGKLIHQGSETLVDFNRSGVPLVEIVTEPDFDNSDDVKQFLEELQVIVRYLGVSDADMEKGSMRLEPNISLKKPGETDLPNYKVEVKNINSFRFAKNAIDFEEKRHKQILEKGETPIQETRGYVDAKGTTVSQRVKEEAADYRYLPDPDIPPFELSEEFIKDIEEQMPELPEDRIKRYEAEKVTYENAYIITRDKKFADYYDGVMNVFGSSDGLSLKGKTLHDEIARILVNKMLSTDLSTQEFVSKARALLTPIATDSGALDSAISTVVSVNPDAVAQYKSGKEGVLMFLVGQVMKEMKGQANAQEVKKRLLENLSS